MSEPDEDDVQPSPIAEAVKAKLTEAGFEVSDGLPVLGSPRAVVTNADGLVVYEAEVRRTTDGFELREVTR